MISLSLFIQISTKGDTHSGERVRSFWWSASSLPSSSSRDKRNGLDVSWCRCDTQTRNYYRQHLAFGATTTINDMAWRHVPALIVGLEAFIVIVIQRQAAVVAITFVVVLPPFLYTVVLMTLRPLVSYTLRFSISFVDIHPFVGKRIWCKNAVGQMATSIPWPRFARTC